MTDTRDMTEGKILRQVIPLAVPLLLANMGQQLYMIVDGSIVGRGIGAKALASVGASDWCYWLILWSSLSLTHGFSTFVSRFFGRHDYSKMNRVITNGAVLTFVIGGLLTVVGLLVSRPLLELLHTPGDIIDDAVIYIRTMLSGTLIVAAYNFTAAILRALGNGKAPLVAMGIAALVNIGLDLLFVLVFQWGIFGAAIASVLAQLLSFLYCLHRIRRIEIIRITREDWKMDWPLSFRMLAFSIPIAVSFIIVAVSGIILQSTVNKLGSIYVAGFTAPNKLYGILEATSLALGQAFATFLSQNYGAGKFDRVKEGTRKGVLLALLMALAVTALIVPFIRPLLSCFIDASEKDAAAIMAVAWKYMFIMTVSIVLVYPIHIYRGALQSVGNSIWPMISGFAESLARALMGTAAVVLFSTEAIFYAEPVSWLFALLFVIVPYYLVRRKVLVSG
ncbi:MAG: MATE family efflux transporter [Lachnospiraceae bacterium]|nr:MATE family efflux transporter [Lachnospiraceae bacterium]